ALATHSVGAPPAATFGQDILMSASVISDPPDPHPDSGGPDPHVRGTVPDHPDHKAEGGHGHGGIPHESPRTMTYVLVTLAVGCAATIVLGFWPPLGNLLGIQALKVPALEHWLEPTLAPSLELVEKRTAESGTVWEWTLIFASVGVAFLGWFIARTLYKDARSTVPQKLAAAFPNLYRVVYNKYYVDEFYEATVLRGVRLLARAFAVFDNQVIDGVVNSVAAVSRFACEIQGAVDKHLVDGAVNAVADSVVRTGNRL